MEIEFSLLMNGQQFNAPHFVKYRHDVRQTIEFAKKVVNIGGKSSISQSANFIASKGNVKHIKQLVFVDGVQDKSMLSYQTKERYASVFLTSKNRIDAKLNFSEENPSTKEAHPDGVDVIRFKLRMSILSDDFKGWRIDVTLVKEEKGGQSVGYLRKIIGSLFVKGLTVDNFAENAPWEYADRIEIEIERVAKDTVLSDLRVLDELIDAVSGVEANHIQTVADYLKVSVTNDASGFKRMGNQVIELTKSIFSGIHLDKMWMTDKADGERAFVIFDKGKAIVLTSNASTTMEVGFKGSAIADSEYIDGEVYMFDVIMINNRGIAHLPFEGRIKYLDELADEEKVHAKEYVKLGGDYVAKMKAFMKKRRPYEIDGLIFSEEGEGYRKTKNYKWKPLNKMTVDFLAVECPKSMIGVLPYVRKPKKTLYLLFSYINPKRFKTMGLTFIKLYRKLFPNTDPSYFPVQFSPSSDPYAYLFWTDKDVNRKIVELGWVDGEWKLYRIRKDKDKPNDFRIAELTFQNYFNPLRLEDMGNISKGYFQEDDSQMHRGSRHFNSFVKGKLISEHAAGLPWVMDMAGGKGQDLFRYSKAGVGNLVYLEIDKDGITEIINRKYSVERLGVYTIEADLTDKPQANIKKMEDMGLHMKGSFPLLVCNFAIHYLIKTAKHAAKLVEFIDYYLKPGGKFIYTAFDGKSVFSLLKKTAPRWQWDAMEGNVIKYSIKREFKSKELTLTNQKIGVKLPFSGDAYYTEYLVNNAYMETVFKKVSMKRCAFGSFSEYLEEYARENKRGFANLDADDKKFVSLYYYSIYVKE